MRIRKLIAVVTSMAFVVGAMTGCGGNNAGSKPITVVSREDGSGTRGAFIELFGIQEKDADGNKIDHTTTDAIVINSTSTMMTTVAGDEYAIGYSSLGSLDDSVKALTVDGVEISSENIKNGSYKISRPFNIATKDKVSEVTQDFINYIMSPEGQKVVDDNGYIAIDDVKDFTSSGATGKIVVAGSSSVTPVMEKLAEAYKKVNTGAEIEVQESDSTTGITAATEGNCDIGMASRELDETEISGGLTPTAIALDGIAVIVNKDNELKDISVDKVKSIYTGETIDWNDLDK